MAQQSTTETGHEQVWIGLTPKAASIVAFTVAVLSLQGQGYWSYSVGRLAEYVYQRGQAELGLLLVTLPPLLLAVTGIVLGRRAVAAGEVASWEQHLGRAAVATGLLGVGIAVLSLVTGVLTGSIFARY